MPCCVYTHQRIVCQFLTGNFSFSFGPVAHHLGSRSSYLWVSPCRIPWLRLEIKSSRRKTKRLILFHFFSRVSSFAFICTGWNSQIDRFPCSTIPSLCYIYCYTSTFTRHLSNSNEKEPRCSKRLDVTYVTYRANSAGLPFFTFFSPFPHPSPISEKMCVFWIIMNIPKKFAKSCTRSIQINEIKDLFHYV